ncbi:hypothetical protein [Hahella sp. CCB-MM4]|uniref:hypothetical protein n=1 Tax=Hahella sp. (strain CCB-MM4) TaxID=1926491 RepID=UPI00114069B1|nr:hypothetical protein [Hahella sp. CCB-MM4]
MNQLFQLVGIGRFDYFFSIREALPELLLKHEEEFPEYGALKFREVYSVKRETPVFIAFGKDTENYSRFAEKWAHTLEEFYRQQTLDEALKKYVGSEGNL